MAPPPKRGAGTSNRVVIRLLMIGDSSVGKTSLVIRYDEDSFSTKYMTTIGVDYRDKFVDIDGQPVKLQIWDTAGQERFRSLTANFFGKADGFVVCFDVSSRGSFGHVRNWIHDVQSHKRGEVDVCLCGCKCDVDAKLRQVATHEAKALAEEYGIQYFEASAKENINVSETFEHLAQKVRRRKVQGAEVSTGGSGTSNKSKADVVLSDNVDDQDSRKACAC